MKVFISYLYFEIQAEFSEFIRLIESIVNQTNIAKISDAEKRPTRNETSGIEITEKPQKRNYHSITNIRHHEKP